jgi:hypothetical protein
MRKIFPALTWMAFLVLAYSFAVAAELPPVPPLPKKFKGIQIAKPDPAVPKEIADFLGEWEGVWKYEGTLGQGLTFGQEVRRVKLIIYEASPSGAIKLIYGVGASPIQGGKGWRNYDVEIGKDGENKYFSFSPPSGFHLQFRLQNGLLLGRQGGSYAIQMKKVK